MSGRIKDFLFLLYNCLFNEDNQLLKVCFLLFVKFCLHYLETLSIIGLLITFRVPKQNIQKGTSQMGAATLIKNNQHKVKDDENKTVYNILFIIGFCHLLNDSIQSVIPAMFPILEKSMGLTFTQLGLIAFTLNMVSSVMQPVVGWYSDKRPLPYALPIGLTISLVGILGLALAPSFYTILASVVFIGLGSAIFHPEGSRVAYMAAGSRRGLAQSIYQVGGNTGSASAPLITALILVPMGQIGAMWFTITAALAVIFLVYIANWYSYRLLTIKESAKKKTSSNNEGQTKISKKVIMALVVIVFLIFARSWVFKCSRELLYVLCNRTIRSIDRPIASIYFYLSFHGCCWYFFRRTFSRSIWKKNRHFNIVTWNSTTCVTPPVCRSDECIFCFSFNWNLVNV